MRTPWPRVTLVTVIVTLITGSLAALALAAKVGDAASVPYRVKALEEQQKQTSERLSALAFDLRAMASDNQSASRRADEAGQAIRASLVELSGNLRSLSTAVGEQNNRLIQMEAVRGR